MVSMHKQHDLCVAKGRVCSAFRNSEAAAEYHARSSTPTIFRLRNPTKWGRAAGWTHRRLPIEEVANTPGRAVITSTSSHFERNAALVRSFVTCAPPLSQKGEVLT